MGTIWYCNLAVCYVLGNIENCVVSVSVHCTHVLTHAYSLINKLLARGSNFFAI